MPDFPIVDTHVHFWHPELWDYPWLKAEEKLNRPFLPAAFRTATPPTEVESIVFVECGIGPKLRLAEVQWLTHLADEEPRIRGIVASAPVETGTAVCETLDDLARLSLVKGVRRLIQGNAPDFCLEPDFIAGVRALADYNFSFDVCIQHPQLAAALELVRQCPEVSFILDHIGKPAIKDGLMEPWGAQLSELAALPNVCCKLSGLVTEADHQNWTPADLQPYIDHVVGAFGLDRVIYGGDWPVASLAAGYPRWVNTLELALANCTQDQLRRVFRDNAIAFYRLDQEGA